MRHFTLLLALSLATGAFGLRSVQFEERLNGIEDQAHEDKCRIQALQSHLVEAQTDAARSSLVLASLERKHDETLIVGRNLEISNASFKNELSVARRTIETHENKLRAFEMTVSAENPENWKRPFEHLQEALDEKWDLFGGGVERMHGLALDNRDQLARLDQKLDRDIDDMWNKLMGPTVQLTGESTVGSGVLLESRPLPDGGYKNYVLTAWHVVRDILADADALEGPVPVKMYSQDGRRTHFQAELLRFDPTIDIALLTLDTNDKIPFGAKLATREELDSIQVFSNIYAAGCPLGNDPIPTFGELADTRHVVDGDLYWMTSAPTYVGNSGGGIFDAESFKLIGIFSKIYTHGSLRPIVVPHMGLSTPLTVVYDWLEDVGHSELIPSDEAAVATAASAAIGD